MPKSNWAITIEEPPFEAYAVTCGLTFTFGGVKIDTSARVIDTDGAPIPGLLRGGRDGRRHLLFQLSGRHGLTNGSVFGRIAGDYGRRQGTRPQRLTVSRVSDCSCLWHRRRSLPVSGVNS